MLGAVLGVSDLSLRPAFRDRYGLVPMAYYTAPRLNAGRVAQRRSPRVAVGAAARGFGFYPLGRFTGDNRRLFGEGPSATARAGAGRSVVFRLVG